MGRAASTALANSGSRSRSPRPRWRPRDPRRSTRRPCPGAPRRAPPADRGPRAGAARAPSSRPRSGSRCGRGRRCRWKSRPSPRSSRGRRPCPAAAPRRHRPAALRPPRPARPPSAPGWAARSLRWTGRGAPAPPCRPSPRRPWSRATAVPWRARVARQAHGKGRDGFGRTRPSVRHEAEQREAERAVHDRRRHECRRDGGRTAVGNRHGRKRRGRRLRAPPSSGSYSRAGQPLREAAVSRPAGATTAGGRRRTPWAGS